MLYFRSGKKKFLATLEAYASIGVLEKHSADRACLMARMVKYATSLLNF